MLWNNNNDEKSNRSISNHHRHHPTCLWNSDNEVMKMTTYSTCIVREFTMSVMASECDGHGHLCATFHHYHFYHPSLDVRASMLTMKNAIKCKTCELYLSRSIHHGVGEIFPHLWTTSNVYLCVCVCAVLYRILLISMQKFPFVYISCDSFLSIVSSLVPLSSYRMCVCCLFSLVTFAISVL